MKTLTVLATTAILATTMANGVGMAEAKSKTKRAAEIAIKMLPIPKPAKVLMQGNVRIYDRAGWEAGRLIVVRQYGPSADPGPYPGYNK